MHFEEKGISVECQPRIFPDKLKKFEHVRRGGGTRVKALYAGEDGGLVQGHPRRQTDTTRNITFATPLAASNYLTLSQSLNELDTAIDKNLLHYYWS